MTSPASDIGQWIIGVGRFNIPSYGIDDGKDY
jgi:hypothetical protein